MKQASKQVGKFNLEIGRDYSSTEEQVSITVNNQGMVERISFKMDDIDDFLYVADTLKRKLEEHRIVELERRVSTYGTKG